MRVIFLISAMVLLAGCAGNPYQSTHQARMTPDQKAQALAESHKKADLIRKLPADADFENLDEQFRLQELEQYVDIHGNRRSLNEPAASTSRAAPVQTTRQARQVAPPEPRPVRRAPVREPEESISFDELPPPVDILGGGRR